MLTRLLGPRRGRRTVRLRYPYLRDASPELTSGIGAKEDMVIRDDIFQKITTVFKRHGAVTIDTPVFELKEASYPASQAF